MTPVSVVAPSVEPRRSLRLLIGLIVLVAVSKPIVADTLDPDCFWHLLVAEQLRAEGIGPLVDHLSFASAPRPWTPYSWLAELGMLWVWTHGSWRAAVAAQSVMQGLFVVFIAMCCRATPSRNANPLTAAYDEFTTDRAVPGAMESAIATAAAAVLSLAYLSFRPVTAALALLAACAFLIVRDRRSGERTAGVWLTIPLAILLANVHLYAILLPIWMGALFLGALIERGRATPEHRVEADRRTARYAWLLLGTAAGALCTPMLPGAIASGWHYQSSDPMIASGFITEMRPFYRGPAGHVSAVVVSLLAVALIAHWRRLRIGEWLWLAVAAALLFRLGRFAPAFAIVAAPMFARALPTMSSRALGRPIVALLMALALIGGLARVATQFPRGEASLSAWLNRHGPAAPGYPCAAADYVSAHVTPASGRLINEFTWGGYLEWRLGDRYQTLLDGRTQLFTPAFWRSTCLANEAERAAYLRRVRADAAILPLGHSLFQSTLLQQGWTVAWRDDRAQVLLPPPATAAHPSPPWPFASLWLGE